MQRVIIDGFPIGSNGGRRGIWRDSAALVKKFIEKEKLKAVKLRLYGGKKRFPFPKPFPGLPMPHLHLKGNCYEVTGAQWGRFTKLVIKDLQVQLGRVKTVDLDRLSAMSSLVHMKRKR